ncbi:MAG: DUF2868 domain-containing protein [Acidobacteria bacterium]|nr:MAG: DUF2868 domain-containing protein [Acidobacteriota bacterium]
MSEITVHLPEEDAQRVVLVRAVEEIDRRGRLLPQEVRRQATAAARDEVGERKEERWLAARARRLVAHLAGSHPGVERLLRLTRYGRGLLLPVAAGALIAGLLTNAAGPTRQVHVLALPLVGILLWNVAVLVLYAASGLRRRGGGRRPRLLGLLEAVAGRWAARLPGAAKAADDEPAGLLRRAAGRYLADWSARAAPLAAARLRRALHAGSLMLVLGVVGGMYLRGLLFRYEATWESTFLGQKAAQALLDALLTPASWLTGIAVPPVAAIRAPASGDAAPWLHLWAATATLFVALPRLVLLAVDGLRASWRARRLAVVLPAAYLRRLRLSIDATARRVEVLPYSYQPSPAAVENLKTLLYDLFGARAEVQVTPPLAYGDRPPPAAAGGATRCRLLLASLAQTPEPEVHGSLVAALRETLEEGEALVVLVDAAAYRRRLAGAAEERLAARRKAWDRVLAGAGAGALHLDLERPLPADAAARLVAACSPPGALDDLGAG